MEDNDYKEREIKKCEEALQNPNLKIREIDSLRHYIISLRK